MQGIFLPTDLVEGTAAGLHGAGIALLEVGASVCTLLFVTIQI